MSNKICVFYGNKWLDEQQIVDLAKGKFPEGPHECPIYITERTLAKLESYFSAAVDTTGI